MIEVLIYPKRRTSETIKIYRRTNYPCASKSRVRWANKGARPVPRCHRADVLCMEKEVCRPWRDWVAQTKKPRGWNQSSQKTCRWFNARQTNAPGSCLKKAVKPAKRRDIGKYLVERYKISARRVCRLLKIARGTFDYIENPQDDRALRQRMKEIAASRPRYGSPRLYVLLRREGWVVNLKKFIEFTKKSSSSSERKNHEGENFRVNCVYRHQSLIDWIKYGRWISFTINYWTAGRYVALP